MIPMFPQRRTREGGTVKSASIKHCFEALRIKRTCAFRGDGE